jgi:DNA-binding LytR/AlgR family response regulator
MTYKILIAAPEAEIEQFTKVLSNMDDAVHILPVQTGMEAIKAVKQYKPDAVLLSVLLKDLHSFQAAEIIELLDWETDIYFLAADRYEEELYMRGFPYISHPFNDMKIDWLLNRIKQNQKKRSIRTGKLAVQLEESIVYLDPKDIIYISKNKEIKTVTIFTKTTSYESDYTLQELEKKLQNYEFFRVHKSYIVNLAYVKELKPYFNGAYNLYLEYYMHQPVPVSRNYVKGFREKLEI